MRRIDLNCDMGEVPAAVADGTQEALMAFVTSANIACGGHAGDEQIMATTIQQAVKHGVAVGAHPGYPDPANFGRLELDMDPEEIAESVHQQVAIFAQIAERCGARLVHVKPHGALYNQAVGNAKICGAIADGVARCKKEVVLVGLAGSPMLDCFRQAGFAVAAEGFADRAYERDGTLRSRRLEGALIRDPEAAATQALRMVEERSVVAVDGSRVPIETQTICIHGDTPGAKEIAAAVSERLRNAGVVLAGLRK